MSISITTPLYYVNDKPHLGSTYSTLAADAYARYLRLKGNDIVFVTGVDEHGQKIQRTAISKGISPSEHCNKISSQYVDLWDNWNISNDKFVRTTSKKHRRIVEEFFLRVKEKGDVRLGNQQGWYCVGCEEYKEEVGSDKEPICPIHLKKLEWRDEENLFFCLSKYQKEIEKLISNDSFIQPISRRNEIKSFVSNGLRDFSISRIDVDWGIDVPGYNGHTFYVWFDALLGYLSALIPENQDLGLDDLINLGWPADVHIIGKDILRFHAIYWPAMLMSAGLEIPKKVFGHGFLTREGQKMGKTLGNILDPQLLLEDYGEDAIRWYLLSDIKFGHDGDFQIKRFKELVNSNLANTIGNLLNRTSSMARKWFDNKVPKYSIKDTNNSLKELSLITIDEVILFYDDLYLRECSQAILKLSSSANLYLNETAPWQLVKDDANKELVAFYLYNVLETCRIIALLINPLVPNLSINILKQLHTEHHINDWSENLKWGKLLMGADLPNPHPIIQKIE